MKIGFDLGALHISISELNAAAADDMRKLFSVLSAAGHELFVFYPSDFGRDKALSCKIAKNRACRHSGLL